MTSNLRSRRALALALATSALAATTAACGSDDGDDASSAARPAPPASEFPATQGRTLEQVLGAAGGEGPVVSPAAQVLRVGENRFPFGVFTVEREQIIDAEVAIYAAPGGLGGRATGPFPARIDDLETEDAFRARSTADDPDAATVAYVSDVDLPQPGKWAFAALLRDGDSYAASLLATPSLVGQFDDVPGPGDRAPRVSTPTVDDAPDVSQIDTRVPPSSLHDEDLADVLGRKPAVLLFATPALCQSRVCGPVVDVAEQVKREYGDRVAFIHQEVYNDNDLNKGVRPQMRAYNLPTEPWLFVIDRDGVIRTAIEGPFGVAELDAAVSRVAGPA